MPWQIAYSEVFGEFTGFYHTNCGGKIFDYPNHQECCLCDKVWVKK